MSFPGKNLNNHPDQHHHQHQHVPIGNQIQSPIMNNNNNSNIASAPVIHQAIAKINSTLPKGHPQVSGAAAIAVASGYIPPCCRANNININNNHNTNNNVNHNSAAALNQPNLNIVPPLAPATPLFYEPPFRAPSYDDFKPNYTVILSQTPNRPAGIMLKCDNLPAVKQMFPFPIEYDGSYIDSYPLQLTFRVHPALLKHTCAILQKNGFVQAHNMLLARF
jgi:hypothetical protein